MVLDSTPNGGPIKTVSGKTALQYGSRVQPVQPITAEGWDEEGGGKASGDGGGKKSRCCNISTIVLILMIVALAIGLIVLIAFFLLKENESLCTSTDCVEAAGEIISSMDQTVDPCDDFVDFTCGGWKSKNPVLLGDVEEKSFLTLENRNRYKLKKLLEDNDYSETKTDPPSVKKMKNFYSACTDDFMWAIVGVSPLVAEVEKIGGFPMVDSSWNETVNWINRIAQIKKLYGEDFLIKMEVTHDAENSSDYVLHIGAGTLPAHRELIIQNDESSRLFLFSWIIKIAEYFNADFLKLNELKSKKVIEKLILKTKKHSSLKLKIDRISLKNNSSDDFHILNLENLPETLEMTRQKHDFQLSDNETNDNLLLRLNIAQTKHNKKIQRIGRRDVLDGVVSATEDIAGTIRFQAEELLNPDAEYSTEFNETEESIEPEVPIAVREVNELYSFILTLAQIITPVGKYREYNRMTINELQVMSDLWGDEAVKINWLDYINNVFSDVDIQLSGNTRVIVTDSSYLRKLLIAMKQVSERTIANFLAFMSTLTVKDEVFEPNQQTTRSYKERWLLCTEKTAILFEEAVSYLYIKENLKTSSVDSVKEMVSDVQNAFREILSENDWMDHRTKSSAIHKLNSMINLVGYKFISSDKNAEELIEKTYAPLPEMSNYDHFGNIVKLSTFNSRRDLALLNETPNRHNFFKSASTANAFYNFYQNALVIPAGMLQAPFFRPNAVQALNYGAIGKIIGHEITHGFDDTGRLFDSLGNQRNWWSYASEQTFVKRANCFEEQYGRFPLPDHFENTEELLEVFFRKIDGANTLGENIADNAGIRAAFRGFQNRLHQSSDKPQTLPGLEHFTPEQLFFISYSQVWCKNYTPKGLLFALTGKTHSPGPFRVRGVFENNEDMRSAFKCTRRVDDDFDKVCKLW